MAHRISPQAVADLDDIWYYVAKESDLAWRDSFGNQNNNGPMSDPNGIANSGMLLALIGPKQTQIRFLGFLQLLERNGGDDGTRTRGLCRDRAAF
jgi:hypothetical protein